MKISLSRLMISLLISTLLLSCYGVKDIAKSPVSTIPPSELQTRVLPGQVYEIKLNQTGNEDFKIENLSVMITKVTADSIFGDVKNISLVKKSAQSGITNTYTFKNVSLKGQPINQDWPWADSYSRETGLGHLSVKSIEDIRQKKFSVGKTVALAGGVALTVLIIGFHSEPHPTISPGGI